MNIYIGDNDHVLIQRMRPVIEKMGHKFIKDNIKNCKVQLSFVRIVPNIIKIPTVLRLDGIYYNLDQKYKEKNEAISKSHSIANAIIYQSNHSKLMCEKYLEKRNNNSKIAIIYNGIEKNWAGKFEKHNEINIVVSAKWRRHKRLKEIIEIFLEFNKIYKNSFLHILGKLHDNKEVKNNNIIYYGMINHEEMKRVMRIADLSLHLSKFDSCPNSVVECLAMEIPVITTNNCGGGTELCSLCKGCIICEGDGNPLNIYPCKPYSEEHNNISEKLRKNILESMIKIIENKIRCNFSNTLGIEHCSEEYIRIMREIS